MKKGRSAVTEPDLERQYITEAVQVSIGLEAEESQEEATDQGTKEPKGIKKPTSFMDFIQGTGSDEVSASIESPQDLVERFLEEREPEPLPDFDATEAARKSLDDSEGPVSDTLARIYASQGNYQKAIDAYERLQLIYPDKSGYFAARIEKVLELKNKRKR
jgi:tetratricopeptide (TPR) repeat protein